MSGKVCNTCCKNKSLADFYKDKSYRDGMQSSCIKCVRAYQKAKKHGAIYPRFEECKTHKRCISCKEIKENSLFYADKAGRNGRHGMCVICKDISTMKWRWDNKEYYNQSMRDYRAAQDPMRRRDIDLKCWFGLPYGWYESTLTEQGNVCAICLKPNTSKKRCLAVDHHHDTGKVRGIVCNGCNRALAVFDNPELLKQVQAYLKKYS